MRYPVAGVLLAIVIGFVLATVAGKWIARAGFPLPPHTRRIGDIDGLRGYLALGVVAHHFIIWTGFVATGDWRAPALNLFNQLGAGAVGLFFMTTGLVFYPKILAGFRQTQWPAVFVTRFTRIVPLVAFSFLLVTMVVIAHTDAAIDNSLFNAAAQWISTWEQPPILGYAGSARVNAQVLWSLRLEWVFYLLILPACALGRDMLRKAGPSWLVPVAFFLLALVLRRAGLPTRLFPLMPLFAIGMLAHEVQAREALARHLRAPWMTPLAVLALTIGATFASNPASLAPMMLFGFFFTCIACGNSLWGLLRLRGALVLGECSFGIYLLHGIVLFLLFTYLPGIVTRFGQGAAFAFLPLTMVAVTAIAATTYLLIERPWIRIGSRLARNWSPRRAALDWPQREVAP
jgi:peptidoglycan/LPS O-acetylase OafA/YrhL